MGEYDVAQICQNGHVITEMANSAPELRTKHCDRCGAATTTTCSECSTPIRGYYDCGVFGGLSESKAPSFCHNCGRAYPWTASQIEAATELWVEESIANQEEATKFQESLEDLVKETPKAPLAASRFKKAMAKVGSETVAGIRSILTSIVSETVKHQIWPK